MNVPNYFHDLPIGKYVFRAFVSADGPALLCEVTGCGGVEVGWVEFGPAWISRQGGRYVIVKNGVNHRCIDLAPFSDREVETIGREFGLSVGEPPASDSQFYSSPAFESLCLWAEKHHVAMRWMSLKGCGRTYLPDWQLVVITRLLANAVIEQAKRAPWEVS